MKIIDVRTPDEYKAGHAKNSVNIPLQQLTARLNEIRSFKEPIILCCASGNRSGQATALLKSHGIDCKNGGSWKEVELELNNN